MSTSFHPRAVACSHWALKEVQEQRSPEAYHQMKKGRASPYCTAKFMRGCLRKCIVEGLPLQSIAICSDLGLCCAREGRGGTHQQAHEDREDSWVPENTSCDGNTCAWSRLLPRALPLKICTCLYPRVSSVPILLCFPSR